MEEDKGTCEIVWVFGEKRQLQRRLWLDSTRDYAPFRQELRNLDQKDQTQLSPAKPYEVSEVTWKQASGAWVPQTFSMRRELRSGQEQSVEIAFDWKSVNQPVEDGQFAATGLGLPLRAQLVSMQLGKPVILGHIEGCRGSN